MFHSYVTNYERVCIPVIFTLSSDWIFRIFNVSHAPEKLSIAPYSNKKSPLGMCWFMAATNGGWIYVLISYISIYDSRSHKYARLTSTNIFFGLSLSRRGAALRSFVGAQLIYVLCHREDRVEPRLLRSAKAPRWTKIQVVGCHYESVDGAMG